MAEGEVFIVIRFPQPWPVLEDRPLLSVPQGTQTVTVVARNDGRIQLFIYDGARAAASFRSQPIRIDGGGYAILNASWSGDQIVLRINRREIAPANETQATCVVVTGNRPPEAPLSFDDPDAAAACAAWVKWRKHRYGSPKAAPKKQRRLKTLSEQVVELDRAARALADLGALVERGHSHLAGHVAAELRALVYWNGKSYSPLLLRIAGHLGVPLPLYALPEGEVPDIVAAASLHVEWGEPSIVRELPAQVLCDLQEWLSRIVLMAEYPAVTQPGIPAERRGLSGKDLILGVATTMGVAHYDEDVPEDLELLYGIRGPTADAITLFLLLTTHIVIAQIEFLLRVVGSRDAST